MEVTKSYKITIHSDSKPYLVETPEKPDRCHECDNIANRVYFLCEKCQDDFDIANKAYEQALSTALADQSKYIAFMDEKDVLHLLKVVHDYVIYEGATFEIPSGYDVSILERMPPLAVLEPQKPESVPSCGEDGTNVIKIMGELNEAIAKHKGMDKIVIYRFQAENIEDAFRLAAIALECHKKETCMDRDVMWAWQTIKNVLEGKIDQHVPRI